MTKQEREPRTVCIVDDDLFLLDMYNLKFKQAGYTVVCFTDSALALEDLRAHGTTYDAVLLDLIMPKVDGYTLLKTIREENLCSDRTVLVVLSNEGQDKDVERARSFSINGYLVKANTLPSEVLTYVNKLIEKERAA